MLNKNEVRKAFDRLPISFIFFDAILKCFTDTFYSLHYSGRISEIQCPGPERCQVRRENIRNTGTKRFLFVCLTKRFTE